MWAALAASLLFLSFNRVFSLLFLVCSLVGAIYYAVLTPPAMIFLLLMLVIAFILHKYRQKKCLAAALELLVVIGAIALFFHFIPGFNNLKVLNNVQVGPLSAPLVMYYNFDKALIPFFLLICLPSLFITNKHPSVSKFAWLGLILSVPALLLLAVMLGGLKIEFHFPEWIVSFLIANIFFVSLAEEALFRGYLQQRLSQWLGAYPALICSALLFGAAHFPGGLLLVVFATLAGVIYGLAWLWSGRLWVSVAFHFALNIIHLLFFTYPFYLHK